MPFNPRKLALKRWYHPVFIVKQCPVNAKRLRMYHPHRYTNGLRVRQQLVSVSCLRVQTVNREVVCPSIVEADDQIHAVTRSFLLHRRRSQDGLLRSGG